MDQLNGRLALVTGAGSGIGRALCLALAREGCDIAAVELREERLEPLKTELEAIGVKASTHAVDVSDRDQMAALPDAVRRAHGRPVNVLVNNAGVTITSTFEKTELADWDWLLGVNLWGVVHGCHFFLPQLMEADRAHVVNISSVFGIAGMIGQGAYCASKFAVRGLSESLWEELHHTHIGVTVVHPGGIRTRIAADARTSHEGMQANTVASFEKNAMSPDKAAAQIVWAVKRGRKRLLITPEARIFDWLRRLLPEWGNTLANALLLRVIGGMDMYREELEDYRARRRALGHR